MKPNSVVTIKAHPESGGTLISWGGDASGSNTTFTITMDGPKAVHAIFSTNLLLITSVTGNGTLTRNPEWAQYTNGAIVVLSAAPAAGSIFTGWSGDASGTNNPLSVVMDTNKTISANFVTAIADVQLVSLDFNPKTPDISYSDSTPVVVTVTVHITSAGAPFSHATVLFSCGSRAELGPTNLASGDLHDGVFEGYFTVDYSIRFGTYTLSSVQIFDESHLWKIYSINSGESLFPFPSGTPTNLTIVAPNAPKIIGIGSAGLVYVQGEWLKSPLFIGSTGNFLTPLPSSNWQDNRYILQRGETRPFMCIPHSWVQYSGYNMFVWSTISAAPDTELQNDIGLRLMRAWTFDYFPNDGEFQRDFLVSPPDGTLASDQYEVSMLSNGSNAPTWRVYPGFVVTPPPGGFKESFRVNFFAQGNRPPGQGGGVVHISVVGTGAKFDVVDNPTSITRDRNDGTITISWPSVYGNSYQVQWTTNLSDTNWNTVPESFRGLGSTLTWTDDGTKTSPLSQPTRFYRIVP